MLPPGDACQNAKVQGSLPLSGSNILELRERAGLTQTELARRMGETKMAISRWKAGLTKSLSAKNLLKAASVLGVEPNTLLGKVVLRDSLALHERELLDSFRSLPERDRKVVLELIGALVANK